MIEWLRWFHLSCAAISIFGFVLRVYWSLHHPHYLHWRAVKVLPHGIDSLLFASGIGLLYVYQWHPLTQAWLLTKLGFLLLYIIGGTFALKRAKSHTGKVISVCIALAAVGFLVSIALTRSPFGVFAAF